MAQSATPQCPPVRALGFTVLTCGTEPIADVIFVHGLQGHPKLTWTYRNESGQSSRDPKAKSKKRHFFTALFRGRRASPDTTSGSNSPRNSLESTSETFWPFEFLPQDVPNARILTYGYDSHITKFFQGATNQNSDNIKVVPSRGTSLECNLLILWNMKESRPIVFVAHSLGGIIVKDGAKYKEEYRSILPATRGIIFLGTPHRGSKFASLGEIARRVAAAVLLVDTKNPLLQKLQVNNSSLNLLQRDFSVMLKDSTFGIHSFQEAQGLSGVSGLNGKVVEDESSAIGDAAEYTVTINANHMDMCRFANREDDGYRKVEPAIRKYIRDIEKQAEMQKQKELEQSAWESSASENEQK
ncbi:hypothetical protein K440DRAFT_603397, partial [Wilcoxina mikolae CBS 423.85]